MKSNNKVSVIMSTYNERDEFIHESVNSIRNQTYSNWELIVVVDDPQNNHLVNLIDGYTRQDERIRMVLNGSNIGLALSLNEALKYCTGDYIARMDADDISDKERFQKQVFFLDNNMDFDLVCTGRINIDEDGKDYYIPLLIPKDDKCLMKTLCYGSLITHPTVMIRRQALLSSGGYNNYPSGQDYDLWLRLKRNGSSFHYIDEPLLKYRIRKNSISKSKMGLQVICGQYARMIDKKGLIFNKEGFDKFVNEKKKSKIFNKYISFREKVDNKDKVSFLNYFYLLFCSRDFREMIFNSLMVRIYTK